MARPLLLSAGSRGDIEPVTALSASLLSSSRATSVVYCVQRDSLAHVPAHPNQHIVDIPFAASDFPPLFISAQAVATADMTPLEVAWSAIGLMMRDILISSTDRIIAVAKKARCDVVVTTMCTWPVGYIASRVLAVPFVMLSFQPDVPSAFFPYMYAQPVEAARAMVAMRDGGTCTSDSDYLKQARRLHRFPLEAAAEAFGDACGKHGLPPVGMDEAMAVLMSTAPGVTTLIAVQRPLAPAAPDVPPSAHVVGALAVDYLPDGYSPRESTPALCAFLESGPPPVVVSYGSHGSRADARALLRALLAGLRAAGVARAVILPGAAGLDAAMLAEGEEGDRELAEWAKGRVLFEKGNVQYAWLLPKAEMLFCHGGAGCTAAALHAGIPLVVTPMMFDQFFYAEMVRLSGLGTTVGEEGVASVTAEMVSKAVKIARSEVVLRNVREFAEAERKGERSVEKTAHLICDATSQ